MLNKLNEKKKIFLTEETIIIFLPNLPLPPLGPPPPPPPSDLFDIPNVPRIDEFHNINDLNFDFSNGYVPPAPDLPPLRGFAGNLFPNKQLAAKTSLNAGANTTQTMSGGFERVIEGELERVIEEK